MILEVKWSVKIKYGLNRYNFSEIFHYISICPIIFQVPWPHNLPATILGIISARKPHNKKFITVLKVIKEDIKLEN